MPDDRRRTLAFRTNQARLAEFTALGDQIRREREEALQTVDRILRETPRTKVQTLGDRPELQTCGAVERLGTIAKSELAREPKYAEAIARLGASIAVELPGTYHHIILAQTRAHAWKELGNALRFLARHDEAIEAFTIADELAGGLGLAHDQAMVRLNLAITCQEIGRFDESLALLAETREVFRAHSDMRLFVLTGFYEGLLLQRMHRYREARETHLLLLASTSNIDKDTRAALHRAVGYASIDLGDYEAAEQNLDTAIALYRELGQAVEVANGELGRGRLLIRRGLYRQGVDYLRTVRHRFLKLSLAEEAGLCGLEMVEGMLALGTAEPAESLAKTIMNEFLAASLNERAITALGYLSEAIAARKASPKMANQVRDYVLSLRSKPEREFTTADLHAD